MKKLKLTINGEVNTFDLPENGEYKCEVEDSYTPKVVEDSYTPKVGDCVKVECGNTYVYYFKVKGVSNVTAKFSLAVGDDFQISKNESICINKYRIFTKITPEELKAKYAEAGYDWDYESDTITPLKWMPKDGEKIWLLSLTQEPVKSIFDKDNTLLQLALEKGLLFKTEAECQEFCNYCLNYLKK